MLETTQIFELLIAVLSALVTVYLVPWLKQKRDSERLQNLAFWLKAAVEAAEEHFVGSGRGTEKAAYVRQFLSGRGWNLSDQEAAILIKSAVWDLINRYSYAVDET